MNVVVGMDVLTQVGVSYALMSGDFAAPEAGIGSARSAKHGR
jgi:hypothetical protein